LSWITEETAKLGEDTPLPKAVSHTHADEILNRKTLGQGAVDQMCFKRA
jgi:hypothetical protein